MREEIQYALSLTNWLALEGRRHPSLESLWPDLVFAAQRLGFSCVKLTLADGVRVWEDPGVIGGAHGYRQELRGGRSGLLELKAPARKPEESPDGSGSVSVANSDRSPISDPDLFEILSELLAEGWLKATKGWEEQAEAPLRFGSKLFTSRRTRRLVADLPPVPVLRKDS
jgi:hypothetical protein